MPRILVLPTPALRADLFAPEVLARLNSLGEVIANPNDRDYSSAELTDIIPGVDACITSWGSPQFTPDVVSRADALRVIVHAAGSVKGIVTPSVFERGICVCSSQPAMATSVAAMNVAMMEIMFRNVVNLASGIRSQRRWRPEGESGPRELNGKRVGIVGASLIGREVIRFLAPFDVEIHICDPYITREQADELGATKVSLEELFAECDAISVNTPLTDETQGMIHREHLRLIKDGSVLVNTSRGGVFDHEALIEELKTGRFCAALDVTEPEPLPEGHEFYSLKNVVFTPHISGGTPEMVLRQGALAVSNLEAFFAGREPCRLITADMLPRIA